MGHQDKPQNKKNIWLIGGTLQLIIIIIIHLALSSQFRDSYLPLDGVT